MRVAPSGIIWEVLPVEKFTCRLTHDMSWPSKLSTQNGLLLDFSKPPEYKGMPGTLTPEDAFMGAVITCLAATFDSIANKMRLKITSYESEATGIVDRVDGVQKFTEISVEVTVRIPPETKEESARKAFDMARSNCLVAASISSPISYELRLETTE